MHSLGAHRRSTIDGVGSGATWLTSMVVVALGVGCSSTAASVGRVDSLVVGEADTAVVHNRQPVQLPVRVVGRPGRAVDSLRAHFVWLSGDSIPYSETGIVVCLQPSTTVLGATLANAFTRVVVRCRPVRSVQMAGPLNLVLGDSLQPPLQARVLGLDGAPLEGVVGKLTVENHSIARVAGNRVIPLSPGASFLNFSVGDESATIMVHVFERVATLDHLRPEQDHVAVGADLRMGESRQWSLPAGKWVIAIRTDRDLAGGVGVQVEGANCESMPLVKGGFECLSNGGGSILVSHPVTSHEAVLRVQVLLRRVRA